MNSLPSQMSDPARPEWQRARLRDLFERRVQAIVDALDGKGPWWNQEVRDMLDGPYKGKRKRVVDR